MPLRPGAAPRAKEVEGEERAQGQGGRGEEGGRRRTGVVSGLGGVGLWRVLVVRVELKCVSVPPCQDIGCNFYSNFDAGSAT
jgi:hypothetical protein